MLMSIFNNTFLQEHQRLHLKKAVWLKLALQRASREQRLRISRRALQAQPATASDAPAPTGAGMPSWRLPVAVLLIASAAYLASAYYCDLWPFLPPGTALP